MLFLYSRSTARVLNLYLRHSRPTTQSERDFRKSFNGDCIFCKTGVHKYRASGRPGGLILYGGTQHLWVLSMEPASCHPTAAHNFEVTSRFLGKSEYSQEIFLWR